MLRKLYNVNDLADPICPICLKQMVLGSKGIGCEIEGIWRCHNCGGTMFFTAKNGDKK